MSIVLPVTAEQVNAEQAYVAAINAVNGGQAYLSKPEFVDLVEGIASSAEVVASDVNVDSGPYTSQNVAAALTDLYGDGTTAGQIVAGNAPIAFDNTGTDIVATTVGDAIKELALRMPA